MVNPPKQKGTAAETAVLRYVRAHGFPFAERLTLSARADRGDIALVPGPAAILEVKAVATAATGQPEPARLAAWLAETETERLAARADVAALVVKRKGIGPKDAGLWWSYWRVDVLARLDGSTYPPELAPAWVCMLLDSTLALMRFHGYGSALGEGESGPPPTDSPNPLRGAPQSDENGVRVLREGSGS